MSENYPQPDAISQPITHRLRAGIQWICRIVHNFAHRATWLPALDLLFSLCRPVALFGWE